MSGDEFAGLEATPIPPEALPATLAGRRGIVEALWSLASDLGAIRRADAPEWLVERAAARLELALNLACPSAAELVSAGVEVDDALAVTLERGERFRRLVGEVDE